MKIGYIGLGLMGEPCVANLIKNGHEVYVWARNKQKISKVLENGAVFCESPDALTKICEIIFTNVTNAKDVEEILFGDKGLASNPKKGLLVVDMSTISATKAKEFADKLSKLGMEFVDAPVSGGTVGAINGTLTFMVGSSQDTFDRIKPILLDMGTTVTRIGNSGAGQVAKSCNQICIIANVLGVAEAFAFAKENGVELGPLRHALLGGFASSRVLELHANRMIHDDYEPGFKSVLHHKDMKIIEEIAEELKLNMPISNKGIALLEEVIKNGHGDDDSTIIVKALNFKKN